MALRKRFMLLALCGLLGGGCEQELRIPYLPPTLANWPQPYHGVSGLRVHIFNTGYLRVTEAQIVRGGSLMAHRDLPVPAVLIEHPTQGIVLFNTGLRPQYGTESSLPTGWMGLLFPVEVLPAKDVKTQMQEAGFKPDAVRWIVLSTMRFDHTGEVEQFPNARVVVTKAEHAYAREGSSGYLPSEFDDIPSWKFIDFTSAPPLATFAAHVDLFDDGSCLLLDVSGATPGTMALVVRLHDQPLLLADDMAATADNVRYAVKPAAAYDLPRWWDAIWRLKRFKDLVPELIVVPGQDLEPLHAIRSKEVVVHEITAPDDRTLATPTPSLLQRYLPRPLRP